MTEDGRSARCASCGRDASSEAVERDGLVFCNALCRYTFDKRGSTPAQVSTRQAHGAVPAARAAPPPSAAEHERQWQQLQLMGRVGWIAAAISVAGYLFVMPAVGWERWERIAGEPESLLILAMMSAQVPLAMFAGYGMWATARFQSYGLALSAAAVAIIPWTGCCMVVLFPAGIAMFVELAKPHAAALFPARPYTEIPAHLARRSRTVSLLGILFFPLGLVGAGMGVWVLAKADASLPARDRRWAATAVGVGISAFTLSGLVMPWLAVWLFT
jgi:hypothetical protein